MAGGLCCGRGKDISDQVLEPSHPPPPSEEYPPHQQEKEQRGEHDSSVSPSSLSKTALPESRPDDQPVKGVESSCSSRSINTADSAMSRDRMGASLLSAWTDLQSLNPKLLEERELSRAIELSLLDVALVPVGNNSNKDQGDALPNPLEVLGLTAATDNFSVDKIKRAYRKRCLETHPDKGGDPSEFALVGWAYRTLLSRAVQQQQGGDAASSYMGSSSVFSMSGTALAGKSLKTTAHWDQALKAHRDLVAELFANTDSTTQDAAVAKQHRALQILGLHKQEAGSSNLNEKQERIRNSCFYLSLAVSYLSGIGALMNDPSAPYDIEHDDSYREFLEKTDQGLIGQTALQLKRTIEGAVLKAHPEWAAAGYVGEEVQAFSDFLVYQLQSETSLLHDCAVTVFDETSGFVDVYKGSGYGDSKDAPQDWVHRANTLTLRYIPGHYQPLLPMPSRNNARPSLEEILRTLDLENIFYVVTDGTA